MFLLWAFSRRIWDWLNRIWDWFAKSISFRHGNLSSILTKYNLTLGVALTAELRIRNCLNLLQTGKTPQKEVFWEWHETPSSCEGQFVDIWRVQSTPLLSLLSGRLRPGMVVPVSVPSMGKIYPYSMGLSGKKSSKSNNTNIQTWTWFPNV